jgi:hypothetical protein
VFAVSLGCVDLFEAVAMRAPATNVDRAQADENRRDGSISVFGWSGQKLSQPLRVADARERRGCGTRFVQVQPSEVVGVDFHVAVGWVKVVERECCPLSTVRSSSRR